MTPFRHFVFALTIAAVPGAASAQAPQPDSALVRRAVLDYVEGFYEGDTVKLARSVRSDVAKMGFSRHRDSTNYAAETMPFSEFLAYAGRVRARNRPAPATARKEIVIYDVQSVTASAKLTAFWGTDYLLLGKFDGRWMITHVLWQNPPRALTDAGGAQPAPPVNPVNLYLVPITERGGRVIAGTPVKLTRDEGVNSQPSFTPDGRAVVFSAQREGPNGQSDVYRIDLATRTETRLTRTAENENSPVITPSGELLAIRWNPPTLFREFGLWAYNGAGTPVRGILPGPDTVGYFAPLPGGVFALVRPTTRFTVALFDPRTGRTDDIEGPVGSLPPQRVPGRNAISFVRTDSSGRHMLRRLDIPSRQLMSLGPTLVGRTAHVWTPGRSVLMARGNVLYARAAGASAGWREVSRFAQPDMQNLAAYVVSPDGRSVVMTSTLKVPLHVALRDTLEAGRPAAAAVAYARALRASGRLEFLDVREAGLGGIGAFWLARGNASEASELFTLQTELFPSSYRAFARLADARRAAGDSVAARTHYRKSLELNPRANDADREEATKTEQAIRSLGN